MVAELCDRLLACGLPLHRVAVFVRTLHPDLMGRRFLWRTGEEVLVSAAEHGMIETDTYRRSPVPVVYATAQAIRRRIGDPDCPNDYAISSLYLRTGTWVDGIRGTCSYIAP